jgi:hypothetical protein
VDDGCADPVDPVDRRQRGGADSHDQGAAARDPGAEAAVARGVVLVPDDGDAGRAGGEHRDERGLYPVCVDDVGPSLL